VARPAVHDASFGRAGISPIERLAALRRPLVPHFLLAFQSIPPAHSSHTWAYVCFIALVCVFLALDLGILNRKAHVISMKEAVRWSIIWITCGLAFSAIVYLAYENHWLGLGLDTPMYGAESSAGKHAVVNGTVGGFEAAKQYLAGYLVEKSLAMDNIFVIAIVFSYFGIPDKYQHRVLFWGIIGALLMRGAMIYLGAELVHRYTWILILFGLFLLLTALKMMLIKGSDDPSKNPAVRLARRYLNVTEFLDGSRFFTRRTLAPTYSKDPVSGEMKMDPPPPGTLAKRTHLTPLFLALVVVEFTDLVFAADSIPAVFAITPDPFIVFTSNIFAIMGLRSLYFCLAAAIGRFRLLKPALIVIMAFVGVKLMLMATPPYIDNIAGWVGLTVAEGKSIKIPTTWSLGVVLGVLMFGIVGSLLLPPKPAHKPT
jgi:tellurite resistance protein TerC